MERVSRDVSVQVSDILGVTLGVRQNEARGRVARWRHEPRDVDGLAAITCRANVFRHRV